jgi:hypothetical protein
VLAADLAVFVSVSRVDGHGRTLEHIGWTRGCRFGLGHCFIHRRFSFLVRLFQNAVYSAASFGGARCAYLVNLFLGKRLYSDQGVPRRADPDEFVKFCLKRRAIPVLGILDDEDHKKRDDAGTGVDDQLPSIGEMKQRTGDCQTAMVSKATRNVRGRPES